ncbi:S8 family serine peptidase [Saccharopolyspora flava]|uniref:Type VII secretion-associated serine protease mycosin n=1 Tax=Saccharopolyspora flava TaxID=95161 RepID=A0A1I6NTF1_9PSEU|nr:S8 family serine peptidase [Saccharopolyspora flava]SFS31232.1 type VII secretion-associated serine protease mycosin [Saccharopolyspora flava]
MRALATVLVTGALLTAAPVPALAQQCAPPANQVVPQEGWALQRLDPSSAWDLTDGAAVTVAVIGTGVSAAAPALSGAVLPGQSLSGGAGNDDCAGRDTFMAGVIAARPAAGTGFTGIAPGARILPIRITNDPDEVDAGKLASAIRSAADGGAQVIAVSVGTASADGGLRAAVSYALSKDALVIAPSDVDVGDDAVPYPAGFPEALAVTGITEQGEPIQHAAGQPALVAPGDDVVGIAPRGNGQIVASGGGIGVAFAAGAAALVRAYHPDLSAAEVRNRLQDTADHPPADLPDPRRGYGVVNPAAAVTSVLPSESGEKPLSAAAPPAHLTPKPAVDPLPRLVALLVTGGVGLLVVLTGLGAVLIPRARQRGWRSAWHTPPQSGS